MPGTAGIPTNYDCEKEDERFLMENPMIDAPRKMQ